MTLRIEALFFLGNTFCGKIVQFVHQIAFNYQAVYCCNVDNPDQEKQREVFSYLTKICFKAVEKFLRAIMEAELRISVEFLE